MANGTSPNAQRLLWAGFFSIFANGVGFAVRSGILIDWGREYSFTQTELGSISGGGLWGFGLVIVFGALFADRLGYGRLMGFAVVMHVLSGVLQMATGLVYAQYGTEGVYWNLLAAMICFSIANGTCEVVVNPMVATLFPQEKTHYLNILHAGWPGGLITGGLISYFMNDVVKVHWLVQMSLFLLPVALYGFMLLGQRLPRSEAREAGVDFATMLKEFAAPVLLLLLVIHALVGYVELGTDNWISKITGTIYDSRGAGMLLFIYTSGLMFALRFFAGPIEHAISPLGLLFGCAVLAAIGLLMLGNLGGILLVAAATVYGIGKTFFWPTMLAVVSERFPRGGALTLGMVGGMGMLSAGFLGVPGIGFQQDHYASKELKAKAPDSFGRYVAAEDKTFLGAFHTKGLDGTKTGLLELGAKLDKLESRIGELDKGLKQTEDGKEKEKLSKEKKQKESDAKDIKKEIDLTLDKLKEAKDQSQRAIVPWWQTNREYVKQDSQPVGDAGLYGGRMALRWTALVPAIMAVLYLCLILYFRFQGGYRRLEISKEAEEKAAKAPWEG